MILVLAAALAIVVQDHTPLRSAAQSHATELTTLWQGDVLEVRGERAGYLQVYNYRRERGGYLRSDAVRPLELAAGAAPALLAILRFLRESRGFEALGISYGAAYIKAVPAQALTVEPLEAVALMAERLADAASGNSNTATDIGAHLDVVAQFGIHMHSFERNGHMQVCYDGELFQQVLSMRSATAEERALAALSLTRPDCIDPALGPLARTNVDHELSADLEGIEMRDLTLLTRSRVHARRAAVWAVLAFEEARQNQSAAAAASHRAMSELLSVRPGDLGEDRRSDYIEAAIRVNASRWASAESTVRLEGFRLSAASGDPGQTCISLHSESGGAPPVVQRCTYGIAWLASAQLVAPAQAVVLSVQPLSSWRELWIFHRRGGIWVVDVLPPGTNDPEVGYIDYAGYASPTRRLLIALEVKEQGRFRRRFQELRLDDLLLVRQADSPDQLRDFGHWQNASWRRDTVALR
jgi:hypothetical protein